MHGSARRLLQQLSVSFSQSAAGQRRLRWIEMRSRKRALFALSTPYCFTPNRCPSASPLPKLANRRIWSDPMHGLCFMIQRVARSSQRIVRACPRERAANGIPPHINSQHISGGPSSPKRRSRLHRHARAKCNREPCLGETHKFDTRVSQASGDRINRHHLSLLTIFFSIGRVTQRRTASASSLPSHASSEAR